MEAIQLTFDNQFLHTESDKPKKEKCIAFPIEESYKKRKASGRGRLRAKIIDTKKSHAADCFTTREDVNDVVLELLCNEQYTKAALVTVGCNTGYRCGDLMCLRVCDIIDENGNIYDSLCIEEEKTDCCRMVYFNKATKLAMGFIIKQKHLRPQDYLFSGDGNRKAYLDKITFNEDGDVEDFITASTKYRPDGTERVVAPMLVGSVTRWLKEVSNKLGIEGHFSSHAMRKTFAEFISRDMEDNRNAIVASKALGHASVSTTINYYLSVAPRKLKNRWLNLNLGLEALEIFLDEYNK